MWVYVSLWVTAVRSVVSTVVFFENKLKSNDAEGQVTAKVFKPGGPQTEES
jgi:hypothetical protein